MQVIGISLGNSQIGRHAYHALLGLGVRPEHIVAVARTPSKARDLSEAGVQVRTGEYGNEEAMEGALQGVSVLYMVSGMARPAERRAQHRGVVRAARNAGVERIVYTSFLDASDASPFFAWSINRDTEAALRESGLDVTVLRNGMYSEADLDFIPTYLEEGAVRNNIGDGKIGYISRRDLALAGAHCLVDPSHAGKTYEVTGPEAVTQTDLAEAISRWTGHTIPYEVMSDEDYKATFPDEYWGEVIVTLYQSVRGGNCDKITGDFGRIVGREALTLDETWEKYYADVRTEGGNR